MVTKKSEADGTPGAFEPDGFDRELEGYTAVTEDEGYTIEFDDTAGGQFKGTFIGSAMHPVAEPEKEAAAGRPVEWQQLLFKDEAGELCNIASNYRLSQAFGNANGEAKVNPGTQVLIKHHGKKDLGNGQTLNRMSVYVKN